MLRTIHNPTVGYDVIIVAGQSNSVGFDATYLPTGEDAPDSKVFRWVAPQCSFSAYASGFKSQITVAGEPLGHPDSLFGVGPTFTFAKAYRASRGRRKVLIVPTGVQGTPLVSSLSQSWNPAVVPSLHGQACDLANAAIAAAGTGTRVAAFLWVQGENDVQAGITGTAYQSALDIAIAAFRSNITGASNAPFVIGSMVPSWGGSSAIAAVHAATPGRLSRVGYAVGPTGTGNIHYTAAEARTLGASMFNAFVGL